MVVAAFVAVVAFERIATGHKGWVKKLGNQLSGKYHNTSHQGTSGVGQHHKTSKLTKLVSHKQIDTNYKQKKSKKVLSQTKNVVSHNKSSSV